MTRHLDRARARFQKEKEGTRQSGHVKSSVVRSVLTIQSSSFLEKAERIAQDIARFEVIDKSARKTYKKDLQDIILEAEKAGVLDDDIREKVASSLALLDTK